MVSPLLSQAPQPGASVEIRAFEGTPQEAAEFVSAVWSAQFPDAFTCPQWDSAYFAWRQFGQARHVRHAAYLEDRLVGYLFGEGLPLIWRGKPVNGMFSTTLAVDPVLKGRGVAKALSARQRDVIADRELAFMYGFAVPGRASLGPKFWTRQHAAERMPGIRPFVRPVDARVLAKRAGPAGERIIARLGGLAGLDRVRPAKGGDAIRPYYPGDLSSCLALLRDAEAPADLRLDWSEDLLEHQLDFEDTPRTIVADRGEGVTGFLTWHRTWFRGRERFASAVIDHWVCPDPADRRALVDAALRQMREDGIALAVCPTSASAPVRALLGAGFVPLPNRYDFLLMYNGPEYRPSELRDLRVHLA